jgi:hypothetical protein
MYLSFYTGFSMNARDIAKHLVESNDDFTYSAHNKEIITEYHLFSFVAQGASGGSCWDEDGIGAEHFTNEISERIDCAQGSLSSYLKKMDFDLLGYKHAMENAIAEDNILYSYSNVEYYGNYTDHNVVGIPIATFIDFFANEEDKEQFRESFEQLGRECLNRNEIKNLLEQAEGYRKQRRLEIIKLDDVKETDKAFRRIEQRISNYDTAIEKTFDEVEALGGKVPDREAQKQREADWQQYRKKYKM